MKSLIQTAVVGTGFMGRVHTEAIRRLGFVHVAAVVGSSDERAHTFADAHGIAKASADLQTVLDDPSIQAVHLCTPNALHYPMAKAALESGKHVLCEKPLAISAAQARELLALAAARRLVHCVNHNLRYYPVVQQIRRFIESGELGEVLIAQGTYFQDWLLFETDWSWRLDPDWNGELRAMGDVGSHWMDMVEHLTGLRITSLCAVLRRFIAPGSGPRYRLRHSLLSD